MHQVIERTDVLVFNDGLDEFLRAYRQARGRFNSQPAVPDLSESQYHLLEPLVAAAEDVCVGELAESAGVAPPSATRMLDGLVKRGIVERLRDAEDRRLVRIALTPHGRELFDAKRARILEARTTIFDALSPEEQAVAGRLFDSLAAAIDDLNP